MPYRPFSNQSRVECIKKKFESSFSENDSPSFIKTNSANSCKSKFLQEIKDLNLEKKVKNLKIESDVKINYANKSEGRVLVKRSPAFRKEKLGCTKSLIQISPRESVTLKKYGNKNVSDNAQKILKAVVVDENTLNDFKRSKTDTDLLKYCSSKLADKKISKETEISNSTTVIKNSLVEGDKNISPQYSVVNKKKNNTDKNETVSLKFSESIRRALQSPLPKGPPPKKPPRTFCHIPNTTQKKFHTTSSTTILPTPTKADIPKLKSKLDKLEKVIKIHETGNQVDKIKDKIEKQVNKTIKVESQIAMEVADNCHSCLPMSNCLNQSTKVQNFKKLSKAKSEFYLQIDKTDLKAFECFEKSKETSLGSTTDEISVKKSSSEAIYDLPCINKRNSFETFGKCSKDVKESVNTIKAEGLHYMCTDVINHVSKPPQFLSNSIWRKAVESEVQSGISNFRSNFLPNIQKQKSNSMSRVFNGKKLDSKVGEAEKKRKELKDVKKLSAVKSEEESNGRCALNSDSSEMIGMSDAEDENLFQVTAQRKVYVSRAKSKLMNQVLPWKHKDNKKHLFECCLLVGLTLCESKQNVPYIRSVFPPDKKPPPLIEFLCFPDASYWPPTSENHYPEEQYYSLVVTNENGERKFGYCRRVLPEGGHICLPLAYCIISPHRAGGFFYKVLEELESRHGSPGLDGFISQLYESEFPEPGERLMLKEILEEATRKSLLNSDMELSSTLIRRPPDVRLEEKNLTQLFQHLQLPVFIKVFSSLLHERKVLLLSSSLRNLSSCMEALQSILLPFSWQHTYIPVLPVHLIEMCEAPTPYVIGLLKPRNVEKSITNLNFEDGILVDLDDSKILKCCGDEGSILPSRFTRDLKTALNLAMRATDLISESVRSVLISDAFIKFFVRVCGNYSKFIQSLPNGEKVFQKEEFIKSVTSNTTQAFLDWFTETAMFSSFIQEHLQGDEKDVLIKLFRRRAMEYLEENPKDSEALSKNYKVINRKVRTLGDKIKDFTTFTK